MSEAQEQCELIKWADSCVKTNIHPELAMLYAVPNGGRRDKAEAAHLKMQGVKAGVPDLCLAVPKGKYHGLYIELKVEKIKHLNIKTGGYKISLGVVMLSKYVMAAGQQNKQLKNI